MSVSGLCQICQNSEADRSCERCGNLVCDRHVDRETGLCADCTAEIGGSEPADREDRPDGVDTYRF